MKEFLEVLNAALPVFAVIGVGLGMRRRNWLTGEADQSLLQVTINVLVPCFILDSILNNQALRQPGNFLVAPLVGAGTVCLGVGLARVFWGWSGLTDERARRTFAFTTGIYNYGYVPIPLALLLFDRETVGVLLVHNVGAEIAIWTAGLAVLRGAGGGFGWKHILSAPAVAIVIALALNFAGGQRWLPQFVLTGAHMLGQCAIPLGLVLIGATIADHLHEFQAAAGWRVMAGSCGLRLGLIPVLFLLLAKYLPCSVELKRVIVLQAAMPAAVFPIVMARHYGGDAGTALRVVIGSSVLGLATIPLWIKFGLKFVGLP
jgi:predicted permease